jgi:hypothetical protein
MSIFIKGSIYFGFESSKISDLLDAIIVNFGELLFGILE